MNAFIYTGKNDARIFGRNVFGERETDGQAVILHEHETCD